MTSDDTSQVVECFELHEAEFDAGWCETVGIAGGIEIDDTPSIEECERIYRLTA